MDVISCQSKEFLLFVQPGYSFAEGIQCSLRAIGKMEFIQDTADIFGYGAFVNDEFSGDFLVAEARAQSSVSFPIRAVSMDQQCIATRKGD